MRYKSGMAAMVLSLALVCTGCASQADQFYSEGVASLEAGQYEAAVTYFQQGVETKQRLAENYRGLGIAYYNTGDYASAVTVLKQSLEEMDTVNDAFTIDVYYYLAEAYRARGELVPLRRGLYKTAGVHPYSGGLRTPWDSLYGKG